jgi:twinkle protein
MAREIAYAFHGGGLAVGCVFLEESYKKTVAGFVAIDRNVPLGDLRVNPQLVSEEDYRESLERVVHSGRIFLYNHFGSLESDNLLSKLRYFAVGLQVDFIFLDHISIAISGTESSREGERKDIDKLMTRLREMIEQTGVGVIAVCHLTKPDGTPHEEGGRVRLDHLRGSGTLKQIPDNIVAIERDQQGEDPRAGTVRVLKNREFGDVGPADDIRYNPKTGRMLPEGIFGDVDDTF